MKLRVADAAALLAADEQRVYDWIEDDALPAQKIGGEYRINRSDLLEWATQHDVAVAPHAFRQERETPSLADALRAGGVHANVGGADAASVVRNVVALLPLDEDDRETLAQIVVARDRFGVTPVGGGIAIPHVRTPVVLAHSGAVLSLAYVAAPVAIASEAVDTMFFLLSATTHIHLAMLAKLAAALKDERFRAAVRARAGAEEIVLIASEIEERF